MQFSQPAGGIQGGLASQGAGDMNMAHLGGLRALGGMGDAGRMGMGQNQLSGQELLEQQACRADLCRLCRTNGRVSSSTLKHDARRVQVHVSGSV